MIAENTAATSGHERAFKLEATPVTFGPGVSEEAGWEMMRLGAKRVMLVSDPGVVQAGITGKIRDIIEAAGIECDVFDRVHIEPTLESLQEATDFATDGGFDGFVGVGGGCMLDTDKVADFLPTPPRPPKLPKIVRLFRGPIRYPISGQPEPWSTADCTLGVPWPTAMIWGLGQT